MVAYRKQHYIKKPQNVQVSAFIDPHETNVHFDVQIPTLIAQYLDLLKFQTV